MTFDSDAYIAATDREGAAVSAVASAGDLAAPVPSCPRWNLRQLVGHLGWVYNWVSEHIERRSTTMLSREDFPKPPEGEAVVEWFTGSHARVVAALGDIEPTEAVWAFAGDTGAFWHRRMAHESLIHRWDAESAAGDPGPLDSELAADGMDELVEVILPLQVRLGKDPLPEGSLHLHRTDGEGEWLCRIEEGRLVAERVHARGDVAVRGSGEELDLLLWERLAPDGLEVFGDRDVLAAWTALSR